MSERPKRQNYDLFLRIVPIAALVHGQGTEGNEQVMATREVVLLQGDEWRRVEVPVVSAAAVKHAIRAAAVEDWLEMLDVDARDVSKERLRLLARGGCLDGGGGGVSEPVGAVTAMGDLCPLLRLFGFMDNAGSRPAAFQVSDALPWSELTLEAEVVPRTVWTPDGEVACFDTAPIPDALIRTRLQSYARGAAGVRSTFEDYAGDETPMPYAAQAIAPGTPLVVTLRLLRVTVSDLEVVRRAVHRWALDGGHLGGGARTGQGMCRVELVGIAGCRDDIAVAYAARVGGVREAARRWLLEEADPAVAVEPVAAPAKRGRPRSATPAVAAG
jgi:hypothetical protein